MPVRVIAGALMASLSVSIVMGILTTGSGPHAGDGGAARNGLDSWLLQHLHAWPSYVVLGLSVTLVGLSVLAGVGSPRFGRTAWALLAIVGAQIAVGISQARNGLPEILVGIHMVLAAIVVAIGVSLLLAMRTEAKREEADLHPRLQTAASSN
jgi:cytochrome c oxidase assembly protein subunit 15